MKKLLSMVLLFSLFLTFACDSGSKDDTATTAADNTQETTTNQAEATNEAAPEVAEKVKTAAAPVNQDTESRLISFFKSKFGTRLPGNATVTLGEFKSSDIKGIDEGSFIVDIPGRGEQPIPMLISQDRKYLIIGASESTNIGDFEASGMPGLKQGTLNFGRQQIPF